jgi:hypothetical protein
MLVTPQPLVCMAMQLAVQEGGLRWSAAVLGVAVMR